LSPARPMARFEKETATKSRKAPDPTDLRHRAESRLMGQPWQSEAATTKGGAQRLLHELQIHEIELELQNEELRKSREEEERLKARCSEFYDFSPTAFISLGNSGAIVETNLSAARLLGKERSALVGLGFQSFVSEADRTTFQDFLGGVFSTDTRQTCEIELRGKEREAIFARIEGVRSSVGDECRAVAVDISEHRRTEERIRKLALEKELILKDAHHRIKNNMNTMATLLKLQAGAKEDCGARKELMDAESRIKSMMLLYDRLYCSKDACSLSVKEYLPSLVDEIVSIFPRERTVKVASSMDDITLDASRMSVLGLILNELVTNAMKYAFTGRDAGKIGVSAMKNGQSISLRFEDDGIGIPESIASGESSGFGLMLVSMLAEQLGGKACLARKLGTIVDIEFPL